MKRSITWYGDGVGVSCSDECNAENPSCAGEVGVCVTACDNACCGCFSGDWKKGDVVRREKGSVVCEKGVGGLKAEEGNISEI